MSFFDEFEVVPKCYLKDGDIYIFAKQIFLEKIDEQTILEREVPLILRWKKVTE